MGTLMGAVDTAHGLADWIEPNAMVLEDEYTEPLLLGALDAPAPIGTPMLRFCDPPRDRLVRDPAREPITLLDARTDYQPKKRGWCDRCPSKVDVLHHLWVPMGASVVDLACCWLCKSILDEGYGPLVWE